MRCEHFEKLIPLYVGGDMEPLEADSVRQHLNTCAHCRRLNEEFQASQAWLTGYAVPEFDEASLANMRASVFREIKRQEKRGSWPAWIDWLLPKWSPRLMMASAAVVLAITTGLVVVVYRQQPIPVKSGGEIIAINDKQADTSNIEQSGSDSGGVAVSNPISGKHRSFRSKRVDSPLPPEAFNNGGFPNTLEPPVIPEETAEQVAATAPAEQVAATASAEPVEKEMLRIELQTADPNIRIIWLTPKPDSSSNTKTK